MTLMITAALVALL